LESFIDDLVPKFQALESEAVLARFQAVYENMNLALDGMPYSEIGISDEVKEQVTKSSSIFFLRREFFLSTFWLINHVMIHHTILTKAGIALVISDRTHKCTIKEMQEEIRYSGHGALHGFYDDYSEQGGWKGR